MTQTSERESSPKRLLAGFAVVEDTKVGNCDLLALFNIS